ncbi:cupin [Spirulina subsalsa FACHB-351]|uniref:Cupin n=1 Tax=Spirulina subsalsa FACHB-351 TaxID=234711 RepID=A0ABT3L817_9CYAN|nr:cupin [Spirulina subsalsa]MCW6037650.1 cupin [Spirulina subsalsa FACHB-351]
MTSQDWLVNNEGVCRGVDWGNSEADSLRPYRLYRFLTDLEDILEQIPDDALRLQAICPLVRQLLRSSSWLQIPMVEPNPETGWGVLMLYDEPFFPLTLQLVAWAPGVVSPIHNHACWGLVALLSGDEKNTFWRRSGREDVPDSIEKVGDRIFGPGDVLCLMPEAIHHVEAISPEPTLSFNLYGETNYQQRFQFDVLTGTARNF